MRVLTPTSDEKIRRYIRANDILSVLLAGPIAVALRDPDLFTGGHLGPTSIYCSIGFAAGLFTLVVFHFGKTLSDYVSMREVQYVAAVSLAATALTAFLVFTFNRLDLVPRSIPLIHFLVLTSLMLVGRVVATKRRDRRERTTNHLTSKSEHTLIVGANRFAWFYLRMLDGFNIEHANVAAILDDDPRLFGRLFFGHSVIAPPSELRRIVAEYQVHGVHIDRILISGNRRPDGPQSWREIEEYSRDSNISVEYLGDILGIRVGAPPVSNPVPEIAASPARPYMVLKRFVDFSTSLAMLSVLLPFFSLVALGVLVDLGWPVLFWQKRIGYRGQPFLIYKFRTLRAPFDRQGQYVPEDQRESRFGRLLSRTRVNELLQLWNVLVGEMSLVGPRPLLPVDQPSTSKLRLQVRPGLTGWAQIHGGKLVGADEKGVLDDWYVERASLKLDVSIALRTVSLLAFGDRRAAAKKPASRPSSDTALVGRRSLKGL